VGNDESWTSEYLFVGLRIRPSVWCMPCPYVSDQNDTFFWVRQTFGSDVVSDQEELIDAERIGCVWNYENIWLNCQKDDTINSIQWDLSNESNWKTMAKSAIQVLRKYVAC